MNNVKLESLLRKNEEMICDILVGRKRMKLHFKVVLHWCIFNGFNSQTIRFSKKWRKLPTIENCNSNMWLGQQKIYKILFDNSIVSVRQTTKTNQSILLFYETVNLVKEF